MVPLTMQEKVCSHYKECGGCKLQGIDYPGQLFIKEERIRKLKKLFGLNIPQKPVNYFHPWHYRGKMEFTFSEAEGKLICGLHHKNRKREVVDIEECLLCSLAANDIRNISREFFQSKKYSAYNRFSKKGFLRNLVIREAKFNKGILVGVVVTSQDKFASQEYMEVLKESKYFSYIKGVILVINDSCSDAVVFQKKEVLWGSEYIVEKLGKFNFQISLESFFQVNSAGVKELYGKIRDYTEFIPEKKVLDLYCGVGSIGIYLAKFSHFVWGIEINSVIVKDAKKNARINGLSNIAFLEGNTRRLLYEKMPVFKGNIDLIIANPPRAGLAPKVRQRILEINPQAIVYSSCNVKTFFLDVQSFLPSFNIEFIEPFDFFPHTPHVEILALLKNKLK